MKIQIVIAALLVTTASQCALADEFTGSFALEGHYSAPERTVTQVTLRIQAVPQGGYFVERIGKFPRQNNRPSIRWTSTDLRFEGRTLRVTYRLGGNDGDTGDGIGIIDRLDPNSTSDAAIAALSQENTIKGVYFLSADGRSLREVMVNTTRLGDESGWRWVKTKGAAVVVNSVPPAVASRKAKHSMRSWYLNHVQSTYAKKLARPSLTPKERDALKADRQHELKPSSYEIRRYNYVLDATLGDRYFNGFWYTDAQGEPVHYTHLQTYTLVFAPKDAPSGLEWWKPFVVDGRTGELLDTSSKLLDMWN